MNPQFISSSLVSKRIKLRDKTDHLLLNWPPVADISESTTPIKLRMIPSAARFSHNDQWEAPVAGKEQWGQVSNEYWRRSSRATGTKIRPQTATIRRHKWRRLCLPRDQGYTSKTTSATSNFCWRLWWSTLKCAVDPRCAQSNIRLRPTGNLSKHITWENSIKYLPRADDWGRQPMWGPFYWEVFRQDTGLGNVVIGMDEFDTRRNTDLIALEMISSAKLKVLD